MLDIKELDGYSKYDVMLADAVKEVESTKVNSWIITKGNVEKYSLPPEIDALIFYSYTAVQAYHIFLRNGYPVLQDCVLVAPTGCNTYLIWDKISPFLKEIEATLFCPYSKRCVCVWSVPTFTLPYIAFRKILGLKKSVETDYMNEFIGKFDSFEFGRKYGHLFKYDNYQLVLDRSKDVDYIHQCFVITDLPPECNVCSFNKLRSLFTYAKASSTYDSWSMSMRDDPEPLLSTYLECFGDAIYECTTTVTLNELSCTSIVSLDCSGSTSNLCILRMSDADSGKLEVKLLKRNFASEIKKGANSKLEGLIFFSDSIKVDYMDKQVYYDRAIVNELLGCGVTRVTEKQAVAMQLSGAGQDLELYGDGTLRHISPSSTGLIVLPAAAIALADNCIDLNSPVAIKRLVFNAEIKKISPKFINVGNLSTTERNQKLMDMEIEYKGTDILVLQAIIKAVSSSTEFHEYRGQALNFRMSDTKDGINLAIIAAYLLSDVSSFENIGLPLRVKQEGVMSFVSNEGLVSLLDAVMAQLVFMGSDLKRAAYSSKKRCATTLTWDKIYSFIYSPADAQYKRKLNRVCETLEVAFKEFLTDEQYSKYREILLERWDFMQERANLLASYCISCYEDSFPSYNAPKSLIDAKVVRHKDYRR